MPYSPPGIEVNQVLDESAVATSSPSQPVVVIGPAFQIVSSESMGSYDGTTLAASYASGGVVDVSDPDPDALASELYPVTIELQDVVVETLSEADMGGAHTTPVAVDGVAATWNCVNTDLVIGYAAGDDANAALIQPGDFVNFSTPAAVASAWLRVVSIDLVARELTYSGGAWAYGAMVAGVISVRRPAIPDSAEPGASTWQDTTVDFPALSVAVGDILKVSRPSTFAGALDILSLESGDVTKVNLDGSFVAATREELGTATMTGASTAVAAGTADFTAIKALVDAGETVAIYEPVSGFYVPIASVTDANNLVLASAWPVGGANVRTIYASYMGPTATVTYSLRRDRPDLSLPRIDWDYLGVVVTKTSVSIPAGLTSGGFDIVSATLVGSYRALDESKKALVDYANLSELQAAYDAGDSALVPSNPLGFAAKVALANTNNPVWCIGYDETYYTSEASAFAEALTLLEEQGVYTLVVCSMTGDQLAAALKVHIDDQSSQQKTYFRVGAFCRRRITQEDVVSDTTTLGTAPEGVAASGLTFTDVAHLTGFVTAGVIAGQKLQITQAVGPQNSFAGYATPATRSFTDENSANFAGASIGDDLVIESGTDAGTYPITQVTPIYTGPSVTGGIVTVPVGSTLTGDDVANEVAAASTDPIVAGVVTVAPLVEAPMVAETLTLEADVNVVAVESGIAGPAAPAAVYTFSIPAPIKPATAITLVVNGAAVTISAGDVFSVLGGTLTINAGGCSINRTTGLVTIDKTDVVDQSGDDWVMTYTGYIDATTSAAGAISGSGVGPASTLNETTGAITLNTPYDDTLGGAVTVGATNLLASYRPRQSYHIVYKSEVSPLITTEYTIASLTQDVLTFAASILGSIVGPLRSVTYRVVKDLTLTEQATALAGVASSPSISSRRMVMVQPDTAKYPVNNVDTEVPGWAFAAAMGALVDSLPSHQGLTRRGIAGITGRVGGKDYFLTAARLNIIAGGGVMLFESDGEGQGVYIRHQLTTDISAVLLQELSVTKNFDSVSKEMQTALDSLIGTWNVQEGLFIVAKLRIGSLINKFVNTKTPRLGGKMKPGSKLLSIAEDAALPDTVNVTVDGRFPVPLNRIVLNIQASA